ncbi:hypothetical protein Ataiwa_37500 [Algoriphagus taiwanensis]|uniref:Uncharacterized protein n=1 Tax=Algoriphagus taiwanensis TaxID=1445656 RepID=A0ABQ6Q5M4_9BACT|nr:hypothetical protein Ataiwa_37500 [Algoriphagus taiwanensis]
MDKRNFAESLLNGKKVKFGSNFGHLRSSVIGLPAKNQRDIRLLAESCKIRYFLNLTISFHQYFFCHFPVFFQIGERDEFQFGFFVPGSHF